MVCMYVCVQSMCSLCMEEKSQRGAICWMYGSAYLVCVRWWTGCEVIGGSDGDHVAPRVHLKVDLLY